MAYHEKIARLLDEAAIEAARILGAERAEREPGVVPAHPEGLPAADRAILVRYFDEVTLSTLSAYWSAHWATRHGLRTDQKSSSHTENGSTEMDEYTAMESIRVAARRGAEFAKLVGPRVADAITPITEEADIPAIDRGALIRYYGEISPAMIAAYRGAFEGAS